MKNDVELIDYEEKYADIINKIEEEQWGKWCTGDIRDIIEKHTHIKLAKAGEKIVRNWIWKKSRRCILYSSNNYKT